MTLLVGPQRDPSYCTSKVMSRVIAVQLLRELRWQHQRFHKVQAAPRRSTTLHRPHLCAAGSGRVDDGGCRIPLLSVVNIGLPLSPELHVIAEL